MSELDSSARVLEERARKREAIGLSPHRPTAKTVVHSPPEPERGQPFALLALVILTATAVVLLFLNRSIFTRGPVGWRAPATVEAGRLIVRDDFAEPHFDLPVRSDQDSEQRYVGDLYLIQVNQPGARVWTALGQPLPGAYRLETDLRLDPQERYALGYGGLIVRYQNDENFYLFVVDREGRYRIELVEEGAWRTVRPWTTLSSQSNGGQTILAVVDDGAELRLLVNAVREDTVSDPRLPAGDVGLAVGARSPGRARGLFDWVALYEIPLAD